MSWTDVLCGYNEETGRYIEGYGYIVHARVKCSTDLAFTLSYGAKSLTLRFEEKKLPFLRFLEPPCGFKVFWRTGVGQRDPGPDIQIRTRRHRGPDIKRTPISGILDI